MIKTLKTEQRKYKNQKQIPRRIKEQTYQDNRITEIKNTLEGINSRISEAEEQISERKIEWWKLILKSQMK